MRYIHLLWSNLIGQNVTTMVQIIAIAWKLEWQPTPYSVTTSATPAICAQVDLHRCM